MCKCVRRHNKASNSGRCQRAGGIKLRAPPFHPTIHFIMLIRTNIDLLGGPSYQQINN